MFATFISISLRSGVLLRFVISVVIFMGFTSLNLLLINMIPCVVLFSFCCWRVPNPFFICPLSQSLSHSFRFCFDSVGGFVILTILLCVLFFDVGYFLWLSVVRY